jgi:hypothetical protein
MNILAIATAVVWIDFLVIMITKKVFVLNSFLNELYDTYKLTGSLLDCLVFILVIMLAFFTVPKTSPFLVFTVAIIYQILHDVLLYYLVILPLPKGENAIIDIFKAYVNRGGVATLFGDTVMMASMMGLFFYIQRVDPTKLIFALLLGIYSIGYAVYS